MSDDTKALTAEQERRLRTLASNSIVGADVRAMLANRDALAERCEKLREALRRNAVKDGYCAECSERPDWRTWVGTNPERHAEGCLAAPKDAP